MSRWLTLFLFLILVVGGGSAIGVLTAPGPWYAALAKPSFTSPDWVFAPAWTALYVLIAIAGWRTWRRRADGPAFRLWLAQMAANFLWSPVFFSLQAPLAALAIILVLLALILTFISVSWRRDRVAAVLFVPYAAWVAYASMLNTGIVWLN